MSAYHLREVAQTINVFALDNPARVVVDVTPGGPPLASRPATGAAVVTSPLGGSQVGPNLFRVVGYARPWEGIGDWFIKDSGDNKVTGGRYKTKGQIFTWGSFGFAAGYPSALSGQTGTLRVGMSGDTGVFRGVSIPLRFS